MDSLLDIAPITETVEVAGKQIQVSGISIRDIANLIVRFPKLKDLFAGDRDNINATGLAAMIPEAIGAIIACGVGSPHDKKYEVAANKLATGDQVALLATIITLTLPGGLDPLMARIEGVVSLAGEKAMLSIREIPSNGELQQQ